MVQPEVCTDLSNAACDTPVWADGDSSGIDRIEQCFIPAGQALEEAFMEQDAPHTEAHEEMVDRNTTSTTAKMRRKMDSRDM
jgi:hypothetical protein